MSTLFPPDYKPALDVGVRGDGHRGISSRLLEEGYELPRGAHWPGSAVEDRAEQRKYLRTAARQQDPRSSGADQQP